MLKKNPWIKKNDMGLIYLIGGFIAFILFFIFLMIWNPLSKYDIGRNIQALNPDKLSEGERWNASRVVEEYDKEIQRRKFMRKNVYA